jgi:8-oxo-dGTP pyrophosphatase MutT (NUDIX family)
MQNRADNAKSWRKTKPWNNVHETRSYGIACCRYNPTTHCPEILLVCKRSTYAFLTFVLGKYRYDMRTLRELFEQMTVEEKLDILTLDFRQIWHRAWVDSKYRISSFISAKAKFEGYFLADGGERLCAMIRVAPSSRLMWEIPKGHKKGAQEGPLTCAIREFGEETGLKKKQYTLLGTQRFVQSFTDARINYTSEYFLAAEKRPTNPQVNLQSVDQYGEISDIRWMDLATIRQVDYNGRIGDMAARILADFKRQYGSPR